MRKFLHVLIGLVLFFLLIAGAAFIFNSAMSPELWHRSIRLVHSYHVYAQGGALAFILLCFLFMITGVPVRKRDEFIAFDNESGSVRVSIKAVRDFVARIADEFAAIVSMEPTIRAAGGQLDVELDVKVKSGTQIPELCKLVQNRVKESIKDNLGLTEIKSVRINVRQIVAQPVDKKVEKPAAQTEWEGTMRT